MALSRLPILLYPESTVESRLSKRPGCYGYWRSRNKAGRTGIQSRSMSNMLHPDGSRVQAVPCRAWGLLPMINQG